MAMSALSCSILGEDYKDHDYKDHIKNTFINYHDDFGIQDNRRVKTAPPPGLDAEPKATCQDLSRISTMDSFEDDEDDATQATCQPSCRTKTQESFEDDEPMRIEYVSELATHCKDLQQVTDIGVKDTFLHVQGIKSLGKSLGDIKDTRRVATAPPEAHGSTEENPALDTEAEENEFMTVEDIETMPLLLLREFCRNYHLSTKGTKKDLVVRLVDHQEQKRSTYHSKDTKIATKGNTDDKESYETNGAKDERAHKLDKNIARVHKESYSSGKGDSRTDNQNYNKSVYVMPDSTSKGKGKGKWECQIVLYSRSHVKWDTFLGQLIGSRGSHVKKILEDSGLSSNEDNKIRFRGEGSGKLDDGLPLRCCIAADNKGAMKKARELMENHIRSKAKEGSVPLEELRLHEGNTNSASFNKLIALIRSSR